MKTLTLTFFETVQLFAGHSKPSLPGLIVRNGLDQFVPVEIRPKGVCHIEFRIGNLPEKEVGDAKFPTRPDEEIRIRDPPGPEVLGETLEVDFLGSNLARLEI